MLELFFWGSFELARGGSTVVEHSTTDPEFEGSNQAVLFLQGPLL